MDETDLKPDVEQPEGKAENAEESTSWNQAAGEEIFPEAEAGNEAQDAVDDIPEPPGGNGDRSWQDLVETVDEGSVEPDDPIVRLVHEYKEAIQARDDLQDQYLRAAAEYANAKRRAEFRAENQILAARERILTNILPVLDDFERAFEAVPEEEQESAWLEGFSLIQRKLKTILEREGVTSIEAEGQPFDPNLHQAVMMVEVDDAETGTVVAELQRGYRLGDRVLRPSMVQVAQ